MATRKYPAKILSGEILITSFQYSLLGKDEDTGYDYKLDFIPVYGRDCTLYRYKNAPPIKVEHSPLDDSDRMLYEPFLLDVNRLIDALIADGRPTVPFTIDFKIDALKIDQDYVEGVIYTALASLAIYSEFVTEHQFGDYWTLTVVNDSDDLYAEEFI